MVENPIPTPDFGTHFYAWKASLPEEERVRPDSYARWVASVATDDGGHAFRSNISKARQEALEYMGKLMTQSQVIQALEPASVFAALERRWESTIVDGQRAISQPVPIVAIEHGLIDTGVVTLARRGALIEE